MNPAAQLGVSFNEGQKSVLQKSIIQKIYLPQLSIPEYTLQSEVGLNRQLPVYSVS